MDDDIPNVSPAEEEAITSTDTIDNGEESTVSEYNGTSSQTQLKCHFCDMEFDVKKTRSLRAHIEEVHIVGDSSFMCGMCCEEFGSRRAVESHMSTFHRTPKPFGCGTCGETFRSRNMLLKHVDSHTQQEIADNTVGLCYCGECFEFFNSVATLYTHTTVHKETPIFVCGACGLQTQHRHIMVKHLECHVISHLLKGSDGATVEMFKTLPVSKLDMSYVRHVGSIDAEHNQSSNNQETTEGADLVYEEQNVVEQSNSSTHDSYVEITHLHTESQCVDNTEGEISSVSVGDNEPVVFQDGFVEDKNNAVENTSYKCGVCEETFVNLPEALSHAESHNEEEFNMLLDVPHEGEEMTAAMPLTTCDASLLTGDRVNMIPMSL